MKNTNHKLINAFEKRLLRLIPDGFREHGAVLLWISVISKAVEDSHSKSKLISRDARSFLINPARIGGVLATLGIQHRDLLEAIEKIDTQGEW
jgi:hypothetical protein